jgi:Reverse transcriptase (RNA-dependent DNA polymerase)
MSAPVNWIADLDLAQFFDTLPHTDILAVLAERITDKKFLRLLARMLKAGIQTPGGVVQTELGSLQGSNASPVIANVFLDKVLDQWVATTVKAHCRGYVELMRYADDTLLVFEREEDAQRVMRVLPFAAGQIRVASQCPENAAGALRQTRRVTGIQGGATPAHARLPRLHLLLGTQSPGPGTREAQDLEETAAPCPGGHQPVAAPGAERAQAA